ncbi:MAG TPA: hypothetical protein VFZ64_03465 [Nocardioidaceae bacterium]
MDLSPIIFVVLAVAWAVYLIPKAVKHHDEVARSRSVDRFSTAMRVLARREPVDTRNARLVVTPARPGPRVVVPQRPQASVAARRAAARAAARRRRHVTLVLLVADLVVVALAAFALVPWWSVAIPVTLTVAYLVLCRFQVRRENDAFWTPATESAPDTATAPRRAIRVDASSGGAPVVHESSHDFDDDEDTVQIPMSELEAIAVPMETVDGDSLWDPLPVTLPTYVGKARAARTVRTIDLGAPGTWTSGRDEADSALVEQSAAAEATESTDEPASVEAEPPRAVGT